VNLWNIDQLIFLTGLNCHKRKDRETVQFLAIAGTYFALLLIR